MYVYFVIVQRFREFQLIDCCIYVFDSFEEFRFVYKVYNIIHFLMMLKLKFQLCDIKHINF